MFAVIGKDGIESARFSDKDKAQKYCGGLNSIYGNYYHIKKIAKSTPRRLIIVD